jgi:hypothetical protein
MHIQLVRKLTPNPFQRSRIVVTRLQVVEPGELFAKPIVVGED